MIRNLLHYSQDDCFCISRDSKWEVLFFGSRDAGINRDEEFTLIIKLDTDVSDRLSLIGVRLLVGFFIYLFFFDLLFDLVISSVCPFFLMLDLWSHVIS